MFAAEHEALDPEYSILKQRLARRIRHDGLTDDDIAKMDLVQITKVSLPYGCLHIGSCLTGFLNPPCMQL